MAGFDTLFLSLVPLNLLFSLPQYPFHFSSPAGYPGVLAEPYVELHLADAFPNSPR